MQFKKRADLLQQARPQSGVDDLKGKFGQPTQDIPGVTDSRVKPASASP